MNNDVEVNEVIGNLRDQLDAANYNKAVLMAQVKKGNKVIDELLGIIKDELPDKYAELTKEDSESGGGK